MQTLTAFLTGMNIWRVPGLMSTIPPPADFGLVAHWNFDETNGTVLADLSGNELNGTLQGFNGGWEPGRIGGIPLGLTGWMIMSPSPTFPNWMIFGPLVFRLVELDDNGSGYVLAKDPG